MERIIPTSVEQVVKNKSGSIMIYLYRDSQNAPCARGFIGRRSKPEFRHFFGSEETRAKYVEDWFNRVNTNLSSSEQRKAQERLDRTEGAKAYAKEIKVGDLFISTISYTMTLNTFYKVVAVTGKKEITIEEIGCRWVSGDMGFTGSVIADPEHTTGKTGKATVCGKGIISIGGTKAYSTTSEATHYENHMD